MFLIFFLFRCSLFRRKLEIDDNFIHDEYDYCLFCVCVCVFAKLAGRSFVCFVSYFIVVVVVPFLFYCRRCIPTHHKIQNENIMLSI